MDRGENALCRLPNRWRKDASVFARLDLWELGRVLERCARELEEALSAAPVREPGDGGVSR